MGSPARDRIVVRLRLLMAAAVAAPLGCGVKTEPTGASSSTAKATSTPGPTRTTTGYAVVDPMPMPARCATDLAPTIQGRAHFERQPSGADASPIWILVMSLEPPSGGSFDADRPPLAFGSIDPHPTLAKDGGNLVIRAPVKFTSDAVATVVVGVTCNGEKGLVSAGVRWTDADLDPGKTFEVSLAAYGGY
ncbi:MAG: hypothetical protein U0414_44575, partial [Polyangiaceae bacterium]